MGYFDLPTGELELLLEDEKGTKWQSVAFMDVVFPSDLARACEDWSNHYKVKAARFNGKPLKIPTGYHWEVRKRDEVLGAFKTYQEALNDANDRRRAYRTDKTVKTGGVYFAKD
jgi:hypothetical protein